MEERLQLAEQLSTALQLPLQFIQDQKGAFMVDTKKETNYDKLSGTDKRLLDKQINLFNTKIADYLQVQKSTANPQASGAIQPNEPATATTAQVVELFPNWEEVWISFLNDRKI